MSGIKISVFRSILDYSDSYEGCSQYNNYYAFTVTTNSNGEFSFNRPSDCFLLKIDVSSLPAGTGVAQKNIFYNSKDEQDSYALYSVAGVDVSTDISGNCTVTLFNSSKDAIYGAYEISNVDKSVYNENFYTDNSITHQYTIYCGAKMFEASANVDLSAYDIFDRIQIAYQLGYISESEKIERYCDTFLSRSFNNVNSSQCATPILDEIFDYKQTAQKLPAALLEKITQVLAAPTVESSAKSPPTFDNPGLVINSYFMVYYNADVAGMSTEAGLVADYLLELRTDLINKGFNTPLPDVGTKYRVFLTDAYVYQGTGACVQVSASGNTATSYIVIDTYEDFDTEQNTIAHEYFHAVQNAHNRTSTWFKEACANWYALIKESDSDSFESDIELYLSRSFVSIEDAECAYGKMLYPLYISQQRGGVSTIKDIYEAYENYSDGALINGAVTDALQSNGYSDTFVSICREFAAYSPYPSYYYGYSNNWAALSYGNTINISTTPTEANFSLQYLSHDFVEFQSDPNNIKTLQVTIDFPDNSTNTACKKIRTTSAGVKYITDLTISSDSVTIIQYNFGYSIATEIALVPINLNISTNTYAVEMTWSYS